MFAYCGNNPVVNSDPGGHLWRIAVVVVGVAIAFSACTSDAMNCYAYALRLEGKPDIGPIDPGGLAGEDIARTQLYASPEVVTDLIEEGMKKDAEILGYKFGYVFQSSTHEPAEGNWLIFVAYCPEPSIADYHYWRQEEDGTWSHYVPNKGIKYEDFSGKPITDPLFSDRGKYTEVIGYYEIGPNRGGN